MSYDDLIEETIDHGQIYAINGGGTFFQCHYSTAELRFRVDGGAWVPLDRGIGFDRPWVKIEIYNGTGEPQTFRAVQLNTAGYFDHRELAAQVALNGVDVQVVNAPLVDDGGAINQIGTSNINVELNAVGAGSTQAIDIFTGAENTRGIYLRFGHVQIIQSDYGYRVDLVTYVSPSSVIFQEAAVAQHHLNLGQGLYIRPGLGVRFTAGDGCKAQLLLSYTIL